MVSYQQLENNYKGKKVFLTGHTGFKGSWMLKTLSLLGAEVKGYALAPQTQNDLFYLIEGESLCISIIADIRDKKRLESEILSFQPDFIFHFAAQPLVRLSYEIPSETFDVNVLGSAYLLDGVRLLEKPCSVVMITTDKVYHNNEWDYPYRENDKLGGYDPYSASKACAELMIDSYRNSFFNIKKINQHQKGIVVARAGNVIGGGDWSKDRLIPDIVKALMANEPIIIRNPASVRPWQHVLEPIVGYLSLGIHLQQKPIQFSQAFNFGPKVEDSMSVEDMVKIAIQSWGYGEYKIEKEANQLHEAKLLRLEISKVKTEMNWVPKMDANEAIVLTLDWYRKFKEDILKVNDFTTHQILSFLND